MTAQPRTSPANLNRTAPAAMNEQRKRELEVGRQKFDSQARILATATILRPAIICQADVEAVLFEYTTPGGALTALNTLADVRLAWLNERDGLPVIGAKPTDAQRAEARQFFATHGDRPKEPDGEGQAGQSRGIAPTAPPARPSTSEHTRDDTSAGQPAQLTIEYVNAEDWPLTLTIPSTATSEEIAALVTRGDQAVKALISRKAKPRPAANAIVAQPPGPAARASDADSDEAPPLCAIHKTPMAKRKSNRPGGGSFWSCNQKLDDGSWCPYKPKS
jgi:hypothetical protein